MRGRSPRVIVVLSERGSPMSGTSTSLGLFRTPIARLRLRTLTSEIALFAAAAFVYGAVRALTEGSTARATANALRLLRLERRVGLDWEDSLQSEVLRHDVLVTAANWVYIWGHWPVIVTSALVLCLRCRPRYLLLRNAIFISGAIGFLFFAFVPVAPPRLLGIGLVDTILERSSSYRALQPPSLANQYAALPSLHFGWNLLVGIALWWASRRLLVRAFAIAMPSAMGVSVIVTGNHFVLDVVLGTAVALVGLLGALALERRRARTLPAVEHQHSERTPGRAVPHRPSRRQRPTAPARG
jgi:membrane-associated phospholipid phosphatase